MSCQIQTKMTMKIQTWINDWTILFIAFVGMVATIITFDSDAVHWLDASFSIVLLAIAMFVCVQSLMKKQADGSE